VAVVDQLKGKLAAVRYYDRWWAPLPNEQGAAFYDVIQRVDSAGVNWRVRRYNQSSRQLTLDIGFSGVLPWARPEGRSREWYPSGQLREEMNYRKGIPDGQLRTYHPNGELRRATDYWKRREVRLDCFDASGTPIECPLYHTFAQLPVSEANGADAASWLNQQYLQHLPASYAGKDKTVAFYAFYVDSLGYARKPRILLGDDEALNAAVLKAIGQLPRFEPATQEGKPTHDAIEGYVVYDPARRRNNGTAATN
jgi:hypothetical protein